MDGQGDDPSPISLLLPGSHWADFQSDWVIQKVDEIRECVGISCVGFEDQLKPSSLPSRPASLSWRDLMLKKKGS